MVGTSINCRERREYKADGARDTGVYTEYMRISSTAQRRNHGAQQINRGALVYVSIITPYFIVVESLACPYIIVESFTCLGLRVTSI